MEYIPTENRLLVRAGIGWHEGVIGVASVGADRLASRVRLRTGKPVISNHLEMKNGSELRIFLIEHGIRRAMNVICKATVRLFGVLEVDSRSEGRVQ